MLLLKNILYRHHNVADSFELNIPKLDFEPGIISAVLGKNASGKTTLLNIIGGHLKCPQGSIRLFDEEIAHESANKRNISTVFQTISLFPHLSVKGNIELAIEPNSVFRKKKKTRYLAEEVLSEFNLTEYASRKPDQLSIGQQQRVAIARATASKPSLLLLDEPTSALDFESIAYLKNLLAELNKKQVVPICIVVSHDLPFVLSIADDIKFIKDGRLEFEGNREEFEMSRFYIH